MSVLTLDFGKERTSTGQDRARRKEISARNNENRAALLSVGRWEHGPKQVEYLAQQEAAQSKAHTRSRNA